MRITVICSALLMLLAAGCVTKSEAQRQAHEAYLTGQNQALTGAANGPKNPTAPIIVIGQVDNNTVPWSDDLTLANALISANYQLKTGPSKITITRDGQTFPVNVRDFLKGGNDIPLQPGDRIDLIH